MTTEENLHGAAAAGRARPDPVQMTEFEKRIAEWEARHDVAVRGSRAAPDVVQHYCAHERLTRAARPQPAVDRAASPRERRRPAAKTPTSPVEGLFSRLV